MKRASRGGVARGRFKLMSKRAGCTGVVTPKKRGLHELFKRWFVGLFTIFPSLNCLLLLLYLALHNYITSEVRLSYKEGACCSGSCWPVRGERIKPKPEAKFLRRARPSQWRNSEIRQTVRVTFSQRSPSLSSFRERQGKRERARTAKEGYFYTVRD